MSIARIELRCKQMLLIGIEGVTPHRQDRLLIKKLEKLKVPVQEQTTRIGVLNEERVVYRIIACSMGKELELVIEALQALGFQETESDGLLYVTMYFHKP